MGLVIVVYWQATTPKAVLQLAVKTRSGDAAYATRRKPIMDG